MNIFTKWGLLSLVLILAGVAITITIVCFEGKDDDTEKQVINKPVENAKRFWTIDQSPDRTIIGDGKRY